MNTSMSNRYALQPTDILRQEHRIVRRVLLCLDTLFQHVDQGQRLDLESLRVALHFLDTYANGIHRMKEERAVYVLLPAVGLSVSIRDSMVRDHDHQAETLAHVRSLSATIDPDRPGDRERLARAAFEMTDAALEHFTQEERMVFPALERGLPGVEVQGLLADLRLSELVVGVRRTSQLVLAADALCDRYTVNDVAVARWLENRSR